MWPGFLSFLGGIFPTHVLEDRLFRTILVKTMEELKRQLNLECDRTLSPEEWDMLLSLSIEVHLKNKEVLIEPGQVDKDVYIVKEGIMRGVYFEGTQERTFAFGMPGTIFMAAFSFYRDEPSYYQIEACCDSVVLRVPREQYIALADRYHRFAVWALHYSWSENYLGEIRDATVRNGTAEERWLQILKRPMLVEKVSQRIIASYLNVTPEHLSRVKSNLLRKNKKGGVC